MSGDAVVWWLLGLLLGASLRLAVRHRHQPRRPTLGLKLVKVPGVVGASPLGLIVQFDQVQPTSYVVRGQLGSRCPLCGGRMLARALCWACMDCARSGVVLPEPQEVRT